MSTITYKLSHGVLLFLFLFSFLFCFWFFFFSLLGHFSTCRKREENHCIAADIALQSANTFEEKQRNIVTFSLRVFVAETHVSHNRTGLSCPGE